MLNLTGKFIFNSLCHVRKCRKKPTIADLIYPDIFMLWIILTRVATREILHCSGKNNFSENVVVNYSTFVPGSLLTFINYLWWYFNKYGSKLDLFTRSHQRIWHSNWWPREILWYFVSSDTVALLIMSGYAI